MNNETTLASIDRKLDLLIRLSALKIIENKEYREQVKILGSIGLKINEIAEILGKTPNNVKVTLHYIRKSKGK